VTRGIRGSYAYQVSADNDVLGQGTTSADRFTVPVTFGASGVSMISVTLTVEDKPLTFLFSLAISGQVSLDEPNRQPQWAAGSHGS
jgi:hypothetical protein